MAGRNMFGCSIANSLSVHLGMLGRWRDELWNSVTEKFSKKLSGWKGARPIRSSWSGLFFNEIHSSKLAFIPSLSGVPKRMAGRIEGIRTICPWGGRDRIHLIAWSPKLRFLGLGWSSNKLVGLEASYSGLLVGQAGPPSSHSSRWQWEIKNKGVRGK